VKNCETLHQNRLWIVISFLDSDFGNSNAVLLVLTKHNANVLPAWMSCVG